MSPTGERVGEPLLLRTTRRVTVTTAGARIYPHARTMVEAGTLATADAGTAKPVSAPLAPMTR